MLMTTAAIQAQQVRLSVSCVDKPASFLSKKLAYRSAVKDTAAATTEINRLMNNLRGRGYIGASLDSIMMDSTNVRAVIYVGDNSHSAVLHTPADSLLPQLPA